MRTNVARGVVAFLAAIVLSGCYSGGQWSSPNLAFWKSSPFQSTHGVTPGAVGSPVKPSGIAANSKTTAPSTGYASTGANVTVPPTTSTGTPVAYGAPNTGYPTNQSPYPTTTPATAPPTSPSGYSPAYTASTAGVPGAGAYGTASAGVAATSAPYGSTTAAPPSYGTSSQYAAPAATSSNAASATPAYNNTNTAAPSGYAPTSTTANDYRNPVRPATSYPSADACPPSAGTSCGTACGAAGADRNGSNTNADRYASPAYNAGGGSGYAPDSGSRYGETTSNNAGPSGTDAAAPSGDRYATPAGGSAPLMGSRYASPSATPPTAGSGSYSVPAASGNASPDASRYAPPSGFSVPPTGGASETPAYRPGSTSEYVPRRASTTTPGTVSSLPTTPSAVTPASYTQPAPGAGM